MIFTLLLLWLVFYGVFNTCSGSPLNTTKAKHEVNEYFDQRSSGKSLDKTSSSSDATTEHILRNNMFPRANPEDDDDLTAQDSDQVYQRCRGRGRNLWNQLQLMLQQSQFGDFNAINIDANWNSKNIPSDVMRPAMYLCEPGELLDAVDKTDYPGSLPDGVKRICDGTYNYEDLTSKERIRSAGGSVQWFSSSHGISLDARSFITFDWDQTIRTPDGAWHVSPNHWTEVMFASWQRQCKNEHGNTYTLTYITRADVRAKLITKIIGKIAQNRDRRWYPPTNGGNPDSDYFLLKPGQNEFNAMLGSSLGINVQKMLRFHTRIFLTPTNDPYQPVLVKTIRNIRIKSNRRSGTKDVVFTLEDVDPRPPPPPPRLRPNSSSLNSK